MAVSKKGKRRAAIRWLAVSELFAHYHFALNMGWRFRKTFSRGPFRWTLSKRGIGWSWGIPGLRTGVSPSGQRYISAGIPGTGLYYIKYFPTNAQTLPPPNQSQPIFPKTNQHPYQIPPIQQPPTPSQPVKNQIPWWRQKGL
jgi:hypothetical protein